MTNLNLVRGLPGSGKTTFVKKSFQCLHLEADMYFEKNGGYYWKPALVKTAHEWCQETTKEALSNGMDVVVSNTFTRLWELQPYLEMASFFNIVPVVFKCVGEWGNTHGVPQEAIEKMKDRWEDYYGEITVS